MIQNVNKGKPNTNISDGVQNRSGLSLVSSKWVKSRSIPTRPDPSLTEGKLWKSQRKSLHGANSPFTMSWLSRTVEAPFDDPSLYRTVYSDVKHSQEQPGAEGVGAGGVPPGAARAVLTVVTHTLFEVASHSSYCEETT